MRINWDTFRTFNQYSRGIRFKFEDLCRQLFANEFISGNKQFKYLHSNPNNYGLECEPILDESRQIWIGFQAKFFDGAVDYESIKESAEKTIKYYIGQDGKVDLVYLYCNKPISSTAKGFVKTVNLLKQYNIELQLITDTAILDLVITKYPYLGLYYFGNHTITHEWFITQADQIFDELGERYNKKFNVETVFLDEISLFVHDKQAAEYLNAKKTRLIEEIDKVYCRHSDQRYYLSALREAVVSLQDVDIDSLYSAISWKTIIEQQFQTELNNLVQKIEQFKGQRDEAYAIYNSSGNKEEKRKAIEKANAIDRQIDDLTLLLALPEIITITDREKALLCGQIMVLSGRAGTGKTQLLANKTKSLLDENRAALLLAAGIYFTQAPIQEQIINNLRLDFNFEELIDVLETIGEKNDCIVPVFIDAINETWNNRLWQTGLPSMLAKIKQAPMLKLVLSYRPEYEKLVLPNSLCNDTADVIRMHHRGFEDNSIEAIQKFLNHYNIPFTPIEYFGYEMSNPLFLTLYCNTYNGEEVSLPTLYERLIEKANTNIYTAHEETLKRLGFCANDDLLRPLISQIAKHLVMHAERSISKSDLIKLSYWSEYGLTPATFIRFLTKEHILHNSLFDNEERFYFAYDQMNDYYCAKAIMDMCNTRESARKYLSEKVLGIENSKLEFSWNIDLFVNACVLYAEKYHEECIDIIDAINDPDDRADVFSRYVKSFEWRNTSELTGAAFMELLKKYPCGPEELWAMLIGNSVKVAHQFNADFLHMFLSRYELNRRDYLWTIYINKLTWDESNRIVQLIQMYDRGEKLEISSEKQVELLLTLFAWILTSSNRWLRDYTSKAMVEILKEHFDQSRRLLEKFIDVNDPYVVQRLLGIIFGACCKRKTGGLRELAEFIYEVVFNQDKVYPDILLRDYARMIIEKFLVEEPCYKGIIKRDRIVPPYNSDPIPEIDDQNYDNKGFKGAMLCLLMSMRTENAGGYGDFGRYVFQSKLSSFDVDTYKMFNYAVYHIINDLGYCEDLFGEYDQHVGGYNRHLTTKTERIGKKYQWITLYEMLARVSDHCKMIDQWSESADEKKIFEGAWDPFVRDFDPTLNASFMKCADSPFFSILDEHKARGIEENESSDISTPELSKVWLEHKGVFYQDLKDTLILTDNNGQQWVALTKYCDTGRNHFDVEELLVWSWLYAYFLTEEQAHVFLQQHENKIPIINQDIASHNATFTVFNREYPWSPSCKELKDEAWIEASIKTGEVEIIEDEPYSSDLSPYLAQWFKTNGLSDDAENNPFFESDIQGKDDALTKQYRNNTRQQAVEKGIGKILHATSDILWESEYDATKEESVSVSVPCAKLIEVMKLRQLNADGFFYDDYGKLAAFDTDLTQKVNSVVVRKDVLDRFLVQTGMKLVWLVDAEKRIYTKNVSIRSWSDWEAVYVYENDHIDGEIHLLPEGNRW